MSENMQLHLYPLMDAMIEQTISEIEEQEDANISCAKGCDHCCHLLIEITWEEAITLAKYIDSLPRQEKKQTIERIINNAKEAKTFFNKTRQGKPFADVIEENVEIPERLYDEYFFSKSRPCPLLVDKMCSVYQVRPTPCRLHMVTSSAENCSRKAKDEYIEIPGELDDLRETIEPVINAISLDGRWGHFGIMVEAALKDQGII